MLNKFAPHPLLAIFDSLPGRYLVLSPELIICAASDAYLKETLTERKEVLEKYIFDVIPVYPESSEEKGADSIMASFLKVLSSRKIDSLRLQHYLIPDPDKAGNFVKRLWRLANTPILNEQGQVIYIINEIVKPAKKGKTDRKLKESLLREQTALGKADQQRVRLDQFLMKAPAAIVVHEGPELIFKFINSFYQEIFPGRDLLGQPLLEGLPELAGTPVLDIIQQVYQTGKPYEGKEVEMLTSETKGGPLRKKYFSFTCQPRYDEQKKVEGIIVFAFDVSELVEARERAEENVARFQFLANTMPQKVWTSKANGEVNYYNENWQHYTGFTTEGLMGWAWKKIVHPDELEETEKVWSDSIESGADFQLEHRFKRKDGHYRWHLSRAIARRRDDGSIIMWIGTNTDIHDQKVAEQTLQELTTELKTTNKQLRRINVDLDNFIYTASHDLKAPITNIEGLLQLLLKKIPGEYQEQQQVQPIFRMMETSVERFKRTVTSLTDITRLQKGSQQPPSVVHIPVIMQDVLLDLDQMVRKYSARVKVDTNECADITFPEKNLRAVLYNLVSNGIKYCDPERPPRVDISCRSIPGYAVLRVQDNGLGIDLSQEKKIFSMFSRLHNHVEGAGIGLFMVKRIVESSGGKIEVASRLGEGSVFTVYFKQ